MSCKVDSIASKYGISELDSELRSLRGDGRSLRELETHTNEKIVQQAFLKAGEDLLPGEITEFYDLLSDGDVSDGTAIQIRDRITSAGIDPAELTSDFVSYQTVRTHLRDCLDIDTSTKSDISVSDEREALFSLVGRTEAVVRNTIYRLRRAELVAIGSIDISVSVRVSCTDCNRSYQLSSFLSSRSCECE